MATIYVKHNSLREGDIVHLEAGGKVEFMEVVSGPVVVDDPDEDGIGEFSYEVVRNLDGTGENNWYAGDAVFDTGQTGNGFIDLYSLYGMNSAANEVAGTQRAGPTIVGNVRESSVYNDWAERWAIGNLNGLYGYGLDTYGVGLGRYKPYSSYVLIDDTNGFRILYQDGTGSNHTLGHWTTTGNVVIGETTANGRANLTLDTVNGLQIRYRDGGVTRIFGQWDVSGAITIGEGSVNNRSYITLDSSGGFRIWWRGNTGVTQTLGQWSTNGILTIGRTTGSHFVINSTSLSLKNGATTYIILAATGAFLTGTLLVQSPGNIIAADGTVTINDDGISVLVPPNEYNWNSAYRLVNSFGNVIGGLAAYYINASTTDVIQLKNNIHGSSSAAVKVLALAPIGRSAISYLGADYNDAEIEANIAVLANAAGSGIYLNADSILMSGDTIIPSGDLISQVGVTNYVGYIFVPLTTPLTSIAWNGTGKSDISTSTLIDLSSVFGAPPSIKAALVRISARDSAAWGTDGLYVAMGPSSGEWGALLCRPKGGDVLEDVMGIVPCNANGDVYYRINTSGSGTMDVWIEIWGYFI